jgi:hypothetical protein
VSFKRARAQNIIAKGKDKSRRNHEGTKDRIAEGTKLYAVVNVMVHESQGYFYSASLRLCVEGQQ